MVSSFRSVAKLRKELKTPANDAMNSTLHSVLQAAAIFSMCAAALLNSKCCSDERPTLASSTLYLLTSFIGWAAIALMAFAIAGLTGVDTLAGAALAVLEGLVANLALNAMSVHTAVRNAPKTTKKAKRAVADARQRRTRRSENLPQQELWK
jgi:hypothetical protein